LAGISLDEDPPSSDTLHPRKYASSAATNRYNEMVFRSAKNCRETQQRGSN
jgi:hypothetical protein